MREISYKGRVSAIDLGRFEGGASLMVLVFFGFWEMGDIGHRQSLRIKFNGDFRRVMD